MVGHLLYRYFCFFFYPHTLLSNLYLSVFQPLQIRTPRIIRYGMSDIFPLPSGSTGAHFSCVHVRIFSLSQQLWHHRRVIAKEYGEDPKRELDYTASVFSNDEGDMKNYHAWAHR